MPWPLGLKHSVASKRKMKVASLAAWTSERRLHYSKMFKGSKHSVEARYHMSIAHEGVKKSEATLRKLARSCATTARQNPSRLEKEVKKCLIASGIQYKFQRAFGRYIVDFYLQDFKLALECDSSWHSLQQIHDQHRDRYLYSKGIKVIRIKGSDIDKDPKASVKRALQQGGVA